jgi:hypothetical protein
MAPSSVPNVGAAKPVHTADACPRCRALGQRSLQQVLHDAPASKQTAAARLISSLCGRVLSGTPSGLRFEREHAYFSKEDGLNACEGGLFLPIVKQVCTELDLEVTVFGSRHVALFESYYVALPQDGEELADVKAKAAALAARWHATSLGWCAAHSAARALPAQCRRRSAAVNARPHWCARLPTGRPPRSRGTSRRRTRPPAGRWLRSVAAAPAPAARRSSCRSS